jgi:hypothetical protein
MEHNATVPLRGPKTALGFAASMLAAWCQILLLATMSLAPLAAGTDPTGNIPICHADERTPPAQQRPAHPSHDCAPCILCISHLLPLALQPSMPMLPEQHSVLTHRLNAPYPRAPPSRLIAAAQPRGPPSLI